MIKLLIFAVILIVTVQSQAALPYIPIGSFPLKEAGFVNLGTFTPEQRQTNNITMIIASFSGSPLAKDSVHIVTDLGSKLANFSSIVPELVTTQIVWPNEATAVPYQIFNQPAIGVGGGFLVPSKSTGEVAVLIEGSQTPHQISPTKNGWFYHVAEWWDMDGDGLVDSVSARGTAPLIGAPKGELVWFKQPASNALGQTWTANVIGNGPDIMIHLIDIESETQPQIVAAEFFAQLVSLWWTEGATWAAGPVQSRVIDNTIGAPFDCQWIDLNNDGIKDLLVTNNGPDANTSAVFAYTVPTNWKTDPWPRYTLATNITTLKEGPNQGSPGKAVAFSPRTNVAEKPYIIVGGDGAEVAFLLIPNSQSTSDWTYTRQDVIYTDCTVGQVAAGDVNGDSYAEFFVPAYEKGIIYGYTFAPSV